jgi:hypothetical protein
LKLTINSLAYSTGSAAMILIAGASVALPTAALAQKPIDITGTWKVAQGTDTKNGPREVIIRADSSASWGKETVRWRLKGDQISIVLGGEWETHKVKLKGSSMTLSEGGLDKPVTLKRVGPATPLPPGAKIPDDPDQ